MVALLLLSPAAGHAGTLCDQRHGPPAPHDDKQDGKSGDARSGQRPKWWVDPKLRADLGITEQQSAAVEAVWSKSLPALREARERLDKLEDALSVLTQREGSDEAAVIAQIERVESTRAEANKTRTLMIYRMNKILTIEQRAKVKALFDRPDASRRGPSPR